MTWTLYHFSEKPFTLDENFYNSPEYQKCRKEKYFKPVGIWLSDESENAYGWSAWCKDEGWNLKSLKYVTEIKVKREILEITSPQAMESFEEQFSEGFFCASVTYINWAKVMEQHKGIIITPYFMERRVGSLWYYWWDCASACIWDFSVVLSIGESKLFSGQLAAR